jgi:hypothetical protein
MSIPLSQMGTVASYVLKKRFTGVKRYPLVLMLEPLTQRNQAAFISPPPTGYPQRRSTRRSAWTWAS